MNLQRQAAMLAVLGLWAPPPASARVVLVGIDGGSWPLIDAAVARGELPGFGALARRGVSAELETVEPVTSPAVWTSIATGRRPEIHGVTDFFRTRLDVAAPTVFERLAAQGRRVGLYDYLISWPPPALPRGFAIPGWLRRDGRVEPPDVFARAGLTPYAFSVDGVRTPDAFVEAIRCELEQKPARFNRLAEVFELDLGAVVFYALDAAGHRFWRAAFPDEFATASPASEARYRAVIADTLSGLDRALSEIAAALGLDDTLLVVSDHGLQARDRLDRIWSLHLDERLAGTPFDPGRNAVVIDGDFVAGTLRVLPGPFEQREATLERLVALLASAQAPDGEPLIDVEVLDVAPRPPQARRWWWQRLRQWAIRLYVERFFDVRLDRPAHAYVFARPRSEPLDRLWPDGNVRFGGEVMPIGALVHVDDFTGGHHETGIFLAAGGAIRRVPERGELSVLDVAPLLFYLAGSGVPDDLEGRVPAAWIAPEHLAAHPIRRVPASELPGLPREAEPTPEDAVLRERLRALGYLE